MSWKITIFIEVVFSFWDNSYEIIVVGWSITDFCRKRVH